MIHLDTSFLIRGMVAGSTEDAMLRNWLRAGEELQISAVAWAEFLCGPLSGEAIDLARVIVGEPSPFTDAAAAITAELFNGTGRRRGSLLDCMIASCAIIDSAALATSNAADFRRFAEFGIDLA